MAFENEYKSLHSEFFEKSEMLLSIWDRNLNLLDVNNAFLKGLRMKKSDIIGKNISVISPDAKSTGRYALYEEVIRTGKTIVINDVKLHPSLGNLYLRLTAFKIGDGLGISAKDITDLMETISDLEAFIYKTTHDFRAPLATTLGLINIAGEELKEHAPALNYLKMIRRQTEILDQIVNQLNNTALIGKQERTTDLIDFEEEIRDTIESLRSERGFDQIRFIREVHVDRNFHCDCYLLKQVLKNLVENAIRYRNENRADSFIRIRVEESVTGVMILIEDNGMGIPALLQKDVFKLFFRASTKEAGNGLGLYSVKQFVKTLGGYMIFSSEEGAGTAFSVHIPDTAPAG